VVKTEDGDERAKGYYERARAATPPGDPLPPRQGQQGPSGSGRGKWSCPARGAPQSPFPAFALQGPVDGRLAPPRLHAPGGAKAGRRLLRDFGEVEQLQVSVKGPSTSSPQADCAPSRR
jgi:hypothetical protein